MHKINIDGRIIFAEDGSLLSDVLNSSNSGMEHPCGGIGKCRKCTVLVNGEEVLSCQYRIRSDINVVLPGSGFISSITGADESGRCTDNMCFALDIGTTTLALALVSLDDKKIIKVRTCTNPQRSFGADVMTRIDYCTKNGVDSLKNVLISSINELISEFGVINIGEMYVAGNVTMLHFFFGEDASSIGKAPYTPLFLESRTQKADELGINGVETVVSLPSVSSFVGADIVAGLNFTGFATEKKHNLLIDLGTNAEIVLYSAESSLCTAAAAGPCFEGANISCGMSAVDGAVYAYDKDGVKTIGDAPAKGVCGTGLVDIISDFLKKEIIDETGFMEDEEYEVAPNVLITQGDIRQYQLAKSAVCSAVQTLMKMKNLDFEDVESVYISGGFSAKINIENAAHTGLLPEEFINKCIPVNNSSLLGIVKYATEKNDLSVYIENSEYVDLSANPLFSDLYVENMMFE